MGSADKETGVFADHRNVMCDWDGVYDLNKNHVLDLSDPFECKEQWIPLPEARRHRFELSARRRRTLDLAIGIGD